MKAAGGDERGGCLLDSTNWSDKLVSMTITATEFKAKCLKLMDKVQKTHHPILITKRGEVVAQLAPPPPTAKKPWLALRGTGKIQGDLVSPGFSDRELDEFLQEDVRSFWEKKRGRRTSH